jgi:hypothetical protein
MSDKPSNFWGGFIFGAIIGGVVGAVVTSQIGKSNQEAAIEDQDGGDRLSGEPSTENVVKPEDKARRSLEQKIAQLNAAIDAVSHELSSNSTKENGQHKSVAKSTAQFGAEVKAEDEQKN